MRHQWFSIFCIFFIGLFGILGAWQLHRYHFKKSLLLHYQQSLHTAPAPLTQLTTYYPFQVVTAKGHYLNELTLFLQNRYDQGQLGVEVLTPFKMTGQSKLLLVDRGWVKSSNNQTVIVGSAPGTQQITGTIKLLNEAQFILGNNILKQTPTQIVLQRVDIEELNKITHQTFYPFILRLNPAQSHGFVRDWVITTITPERHLAYAIQWFVMAMVLLMAYLTMIIPKRNKKN